MSTRVKCFTYVLLTYHLVFHKLADTYMLSARAVISTALLHE